MPAKDRMGKILELSLPSREHKQKIKDAAKKQGCTASKYILNVLEESERRDQPRPTIAKDLEALREENRRLATILHEKEHELAHQEAELRKLRGTAFLAPSGEAFLDPKLLSAIQHGPVHDQRLLDILQIDPKDIGALRNVSRQLQILEIQGIISRTGQGWAWKR